MQKAEVKNILSTLDEMFPNAGCELEFHNLYELCVAVMLSAQTTDKKVNMVTPGLFKEFPDIDSLKNAEEENIKKYIIPLGLANAKSKNLIAFAKKVAADYNGEIPNNFDELITLPGVGRKTANVILSEGFKINRIAVDTHVERTAKRLGIALPDDTPLEVEMKLMEMVDESNWHHTHHLLIFFGRYFCKAQKPNCTICPFQNECTGYKVKELQNKNI